MSNPDDMITVCAECLCASCWQGEFYCDKAKFADITQMRRDHLENLELEHPRWLKTDAELTAEAERLGK